MTCACSITTPLEALCPACTDKAWDYAYVARKSEPKLDLANDPQKNYPHSAIIYTAHDGTL